MIHTVSSDVFRWKGKHGTAFISDFGKAFKFERVTGSSLDRWSFWSNGFKVKSTKTGTILTFYIEKVDKDRDNDTQAWHLRSVGLIGLPGHDIQLTVFND